MMDDMGLNRWRYLPNGGGEGDGVYAWNGTQAQYSAEKEKEKRETNTARLRIQSSIPSSSSIGSSIVCLHLNL